MWPIEKWISLIDLISTDDPTIKINVFSMNKDQSASKILENKFGNTINNYPQFESVLDSTSIIQKSKIFISSDTAMIHLSDVAKTPVLGLFSADNKNLDRYKPLWTINKIIQSDSLSIKNIDAARVFSEYKKLVFD